MSATITSERDVARISLALRNRAESSHSMAFCAGTRARQGMLVHKVFGDSVPWCKYHYVCPALEPSVVGVDLCLKTGHSIG